MGAAQEEEQLIESYDDPQLGHCEVYQLGGSLDFRRRRTTYSKSREELQSKLKIYEALRLLNRPQINTPLLFQPDEARLCMQGCPSTLVEHYFTHSLRLLCKNYLMQRKRFSERELWYVLFALLDCEAAFRAVGLTHSYSTTTVFVDREGLLKIAPDFGSDHGEVQLQGGQGQLRVLPQIVAVTAEVCLLAEQPVLDIEARRAQFPERVYSFLDYLLRVSRGGAGTTFAFAQLLGRIPEDREDRLKQVASVNEQVNQIEQYADVTQQGSDRKGCLQLTERCRREGRRSSNSKQRLQITQQGGGRSVRSVISPISVQRGLNSKFDLLR